jgi:hypothetical protein
MSRDTSHRFPCSYRLAKRKDTFRSSRANYPASIIASAFLENRPPFGVPVLSPVSAVSPKPFGLVRLRLLRLVSRFAEKLALARLSAVRLAPASTALRALSSSVLARHASFPLLRNLARTTPSPFAGFSPLSLGLWCCRFSAALFSQPFSPLGTPLPSPPCPSFFFRQQFLFCGNLLFSAPTSCPTAVDLEGCKFAYSLRILGKPRILPRNANLPTGGSFPPLESPSEGGFPPLHPRI